jgi:hypothetical protein
MKNGVFWDVTPCGCCKNRHFGGIQEDIILQYTENLRNLRIRIMTATASMPRMHGVCRMRNTLNASTSLLRIYLLVADPEVPGSIPRATRLSAQH